MDVLLIKNRITMKTKLILLITVLLTILFYGCTNIKALTPKLSEDDVIKTTVKVLSAFEFKVNHMDEVDLKKEVENICKDWERTKNDSAFLCKISEDLTCQILPLTSDDGVWLCIIFYTKNIALGRAESVALYNRMRKLALESGLISKNEIYKDFCSRPYGYFYETTAIKTKEEIYDNGIGYICDYSIPKKEINVKKAAGQEKEEVLVMVPTEKISSTATKGKDIKFEYSMGAYCEVNGGKAVEIISFCRFTNFGGVEKYLVEFALPMKDDDGNVSGWEEFRINAEFQKKDSSSKEGTAYVYKGKDATNTDYTITTYNQELKVFCEGKSASMKSIVNNNISNFNKLLKYSLRIQNQYGTDFIILPLK